MIWRGPNLHDVWGCGVPSLRSLCIFALSGFSWTLSRSVAVRPRELKIRFTAFGMRGETELPRSCAGGKAEGLATSDVCHNRPTGFCDGPYTARGVGPPSRHWPTHKTKRRGRDLALRLAALVCQANAHTHRPACVFSQIACTQCWRPVLDSDAPHRHAKNDARPRQQPEGEAKGCLPAMDSHKSHGTAGLALPMLFVFRIAVRYTTRAEPERISITAKQAERERAAFAARHNVKTDAGRTLAHDRAATRRVGADTPPSVPWCPTTPPCTPDTRPRTHGRQSTPF